MIAQLNDSERELSGISKRFKTSSKALPESPSPVLDAFISKTKSKSVLDGMSRKKLLENLELRKEGQT